MKRVGIFVITIVCLLYVLHANAQSESVTVHLSIVLKPILNLTINPEQTSVSLLYSTAEDYERGVEVTNKEHLSVFSTGPYVVNARLINEEYTKILGNVDKPMKSPEISISAVPIGEHQNIRLETSVLTVENKSFITDDVPALNKVFDISFHGPGEGVFLDYVSQEGSSSFVNTIIYSLEVR